MVDQEKVREGVRLILEGIGEDINREGLIETPDRIARMYCELAGGMDQNAATHLEKRFHVDNASCAAGMPRVQRRPSWTCAAAGCPRIWVSPPTRFRSSHPPAAGAPAPECSTRLSRPP